MAEKLTNEQQAAVDSRERSLLVSAAAGSGKTKVLTCRIANLLAQGVAPYSILAITFTNKAATEMRERVDRMIAAPAMMSSGPSVCATAFFCAGFKPLKISKISSNLFLSPYHRIVVLSYR